MMLRPPLVNKLPLVKKNDNVITTSFKSLHVNVHLMKFLSEEDFGLKNMLFSLFFHITVYDLHYNIQRYPLFPLALLTALLVQLQNTSVLLL